MVSIWFAFGNVDSLLDNAALLSRLFKIQEPVDKSPFEWRQRFRAFLDLLADMLALSRCW
jgi:hypothetical protein